MSNFSESILRINPEIANLQPDPIPTDWILDGAPESRTKKLMTTRDWNSTIVVWECTPGFFKWQYSKDETLPLLSGEAFMIDEKNVEQRFGAGDMLFLFRRNILKGMQETVAARNVPTQNRLRGAPRLLLTWRSS